MDSCSASQVAAHKLPQVVAGSLIPEPVTEPAGLMSDQNGLVIWRHALICYPGKVPAPWKLGWDPRGTALNTDCFVWPGNPCTAVIWTDR